MDIVGQALASDMVVLVVEDEPLLRMMAMDLVEEAGYAAIGANDADEAERILESRDDIRIMFTDIHMPGAIDGMALAARVRDRWPPVEIIVTSGHTARENVSLPPRGIFVPKPYDHAEIVRLLHSMAS